ncbi:MAG: hypothetical protein EOO65_02445, partial [Methanosarcinales archaeon]
MEAVIDLNSEEVNEAVHSARERKSSAQAPTFSTLIKGKHAVLYKSGQLTKLNEGCLQATRYAARRVEAMLLAGCGLPAVHSLALASTDRFIRLINVVAERRVSLLPEGYTTARPVFDGSLVCRDTGCAVVHKSTWLPLTQAGDCRVDGVHTDPPAGWLLLAAVLLMDPLTTCHVPLERIVPPPVSHTTDGLQYPDGQSLYPCIAGGGYSLVFDALWQDAGARRPVIIKIARSRASAQIQKERAALTVLHTTPRQVNAQAAACAVR